MANEITLIESNGIAQYNSQELAHSNFDILRRGGRKASTLKQYAHTEMLWTDWCQANGVSAANFELLYVDKFLFDHQAQYQRSSLKAMLSHLRQTLEALVSSSDDISPVFARQLQALKKYKIAAHWGTSTPSKRAGKRLDVGTVWEAIHAEASNPLMKARNAAFYALLFFAGLRREELRQLKWANIDFAHSTLAVVGGKKRELDESDNVPMLGELKRILLRWQELQGADRQYVICPMLKGERVGADKPIASGSVYEMMARFDAIPHDARHTLVTSLLEKGIPIHTVQAIARHKNPSTTMGYAHSLEAEQLAKITPNPYS
jgi:integrase